MSKAIQYARDHALTPSSVYQGAWNVMYRNFEREIIPMARSESDHIYLIPVLNDSLTKALFPAGMALAPASMERLGKREIPDQR